MGTSDKWSFRKQNITHKKPTGDVGAISLGAHGVNWDKIISQTIRSVRKQKSDRYLSRLLSNLTGGYMARKPKVFRCSYKEERRVLDLARVSRSAEEITHLMNPRQTWFANWQSDWVFHLIDSPPDRETEGCAEN